MRYVEREYPIWNLINSGKKMQPDKVKVTYKYKGTYDDLAAVYVFGFEPGETTPTLLAFNYLLTDSTCTMERNMTHMIELQNEIDVVDIYVLIGHYESLSDVHNVVGVFDLKDIQLGVKSGASEFNCNTLGTPVATTATLVTIPSFSANWTASNNAAGYTLDVSTDLYFTSFLSGYENLDVSNVVTYPVTGLTEDQGYFYRVRAYDSNGFTSSDSNIIHVSACRKTSGYYLPDQVDDYLSLPMKSLSSTTSIAFRYNLAALTASETILSTYDYVSGNSLSISFQPLRLNNVHDGSTTLWLTYGHPAIGTAAIEYNAVSHEGWFVQNYILTDSEWHDVVVTIDASTGDVNMYFDGVESGVTIAGSLNALDWSSKGELRLFDGNSETLKFKDYVMTNSVMSTAEVDKFTNGDIDGISNKIVWYTCGESSTEMGSAPFTNKTMDYSKEENYGTPVNITPATFCNPD